ncbi:MAG: hypothetical protein U9Q61_10900 [Thermodesulfobacteriota bacterium]|nr:hypothetical protein [Thermodesulfobacteriota bacterium]
MAPLSAAQSVEQHRYLKKTGSVIIPFNWQLEQGDNLKLTTDLGKERDITRMDADFSTQSWSIDDPTAKTKMGVFRNGNELTFSGVFKDKKIERTVTIDAAPWYQALSLSLRQFTDPSREHIEFWSIRPDNLAIHHLQVTREAEEILTLEGISSTAIKLKIRLTGLKSAFWSCYYWLRKSDGVFIRYEGPSGPPGWPLTIVELIDTSAQAKLDGDLQQVQ